MHACAAWQRIREGIWKFLPDRACKTYEEIWERFMGVDVIRLSENFKPLKEITMKLCFLLTLTLSVLLQQGANAQKATTMYVAIKSGLSIRDQPDDKAKVIGKIPYGTRLPLAAGATTEKRIITEGLYGYWTKVTFGQLTGFVVGSYLVSLPPPKAGVKTMKEYLLQLSPVFGAPLIVKQGVIEDITSGGSVLKKQLYKNGASCHEYSMYEFNAETSFIPGLTTKEAFLLVRLLPDFADAVSDKDPFPLADKRYKRNDSEYDVKVEKEMIGDEPYIKKIHIEFSSGSANVLEIYDMDGEVAISYSSGV